MDAIDHRTHVHEIDGHVLARQFRGPTRHHAGVKIRVPAPHAPIGRAPEGVGARAGCHSEDVQEVVHGWRGRGKVPLRLSARRAW